MPTYYAPMEGYAGSKVGERYFTIVGSPTYSSTYAQYGTTSGLFTSGAQLTRTGIGGTTTWLQGYTKIAGLSANTGFWLGGMLPYDITGLVVTANAGATAVTFAFGEAYYSVGYQNVSTTTHPIGAGAAWFRWQYRNGPTSSTYNIFTGANINGASPNITATTTASTYFGANSSTSFFVHNYLTIGAGSFTAYFDNLVVSDTQPSATAPSYVPFSSVGMINAV